MQLPTFLVLGVAKAGTTSLYHYLRQHPQIYMSQKKEPHFLAYGEAPLPVFIGPGANRLKDRIVATLDDYQALFAGMSTERACGEVSTTNIMQRACERIQHYLPRARLIVILRQPAERAYSQFLHMCRYGWEPMADFRAALAAEETRRQQNWQPVFLYTPPGYYYADLQRFFDAFPREQIRVYLYEEWQAQPVTILQDLFRFIDVDDQFVPNMSVRHNAGAIPRSSWLNHWLRTSNRFKAMVKHLLSLETRRALAQRLLRYNSKKPPPLDPNVRAWLTERYRDDILGVQTLLGRDLSHWLIKE